MTEAAIAITPEQREQILERVRAESASYARIVRKAPRPKNAPPPIGSKRLAGTYRVIHGNVSIAVPLEERLNPDGSEDPTAPKQLRAVPGDEVQLNDADAERLLAAGVVEPLNAKVSRVGQGWKPPPAVKNGSVALAEAKPQPRRL